jgi:hypothetical protein
MLRQSPWSMRLLSELLGRAYDTGIDWGCMVGVSGYGVQGSGRAGAWLQALQTAAGAGPVASSSLAGCGGGLSPPGRLPRFTHVLVLLLFYSYLFYYAFYAALVRSAEGWGWAG